MSFVPGRRMAAGFAVFLSAIVCGCSRPDADVTRPATSPAALDPPTPATTDTSELQDWAQQATGTTSSRPAQTGSAQASSDALAAPMIHTVD
ncbi:hypothetical protein [Caballeronia sp. LZ035]|uniref:hypothetical protein n=1 Tax=Caballeronia sp. LZ035 TaxID=3038568 RepID=UPI002865B618|nr:hypothetical protein [Caballeronia sp. LZ035]MDR5759827.1 hypothetical protein [Caballeronia sp. LZ035]